MHNYKELKIWQRAMEYAEEIYKLTALLPVDEKFGLISQIRRSSIAVASNIAEGCGRHTDKQLHQFLSVALGSLCEIDTQILLCERLNILSHSQVDKLNQENNELQKMVYSFMKSLNQS